MTPGAFLQRCPTLCHVGPVGAWEAFNNSGSALPVS